jgi:hypothetical protein
VAFASWAGEFASERAAAVSEEKLDRFARGELSPMEARELARKALDDPELFEELTYSSVARMDLADRKRQRWPWTVALLAAAAAVVLVLSPYAIRQFRPSRAPLVAVSGPPIFLAARGDSATVFRGAEPDSRGPRATGSVTSVADGSVSIDLGSLDGLWKGAEVDVLRDGQAIGRIKLATIFRDRARTEAAPGVTVRLHDSVRVPRAASLRAALDQIAAFSARGDADGARRVAEQAAAGGRLDLAATDYEDWNNLGAIAELGGDRLKAQSLYEHALHANPPAPARATIESNLARVQAVK